MQVSIHPANPQFLMQFFLRQSCISCLLSNINVLDTDRYNTLKPCLSYDFIFISNQYESQHNVVLQLSLLISKLCQHHSTNRIQPT